ncbi:MAG: hypothetical protein JWL63_48 [Rhodocyclales bacterium]|nr:hypothetical protein [Rhodocyclales bacterium]
MTDELIVENAGMLSIQTAVNMDTAAAVLAAAEPYVRARNCVLDWAAVPAVDSSALSVLLSLLRIAMETRHRLAVVNTPPAFNSLAALYGVDAIIAEHLVPTNTILLHA